MGIEPEGAEGVSVLKIHAPFISIEIEITHKAVGTVTPLLLETVPNGRDGV